MRLAAAVWLSFALLITAFSGNDALKVLLFQHGFSGSHLRFAGSLAKILHERNHTVDHIVHYMNPLVRPHNTFAFRELFDVTVPEEENEFLALNHMNTPFEQHSGDFFYGPQLEIIRRSYAQFCDATLGNTTLMDKLRSQRYDIVLTSAYTLCPYSLAYALDVHSVIGFAATAGVDEIDRLFGIPHPSSYHISYFQARFDYRNFFHRAWSFMEMWRRFFYGILDIEREAIRSQLPNAPSPDQLLQRAAYLMVNTDEIIDFNRPATAKLKYIGGIASENTQNVPHIDSKLSAILEKSSRGVVVMSFGSLLRTSQIPIQKKIEIIEAFKQFPDYTFVWKYDDDEADSSLFVNATNIHRVKWLPQIALLRHPRVRAFITHMGQNSYLELTAAGIPAIAIPIFADQNYNADVAAHKGIAIRLCKIELNRETLAGALREILENPRYTEKAREIAQMLARKPGRIDADEFTRLVEYTAAFPSLGADVLWTAPADLSIIELYSYDVMLALLTGAILVVVLALIALARLVALALACQRPAVVTLKCDEPKSQ